MLREIYDLKKILVFFGSPLVHELRIIQREDRSWELEDGTIFGW
jgi:hypothetical protein